MSESRLWQCPGCTKTYRVPAHKADPDICPACRRAVAPTQPRPTAPPMPADNEAVAEPATPASKPPGSGATLAAAWQTLDDNTRKNIIGGSVLAALVLVALVLTRGNEPPSNEEKTPTAAATAASTAPPASNPAPSEAQDAMVRVQVWVETENNPLHPKAELWFRGHGSWWLKPIEAMGGEAKSLGRRPVGRVVSGDDAIQLYPEGREGEATNIPLKMTREMNPDGSDRDSLLIIFTDEAIEILGIPLEAAIGQVKVIVSRPQVSGQPIGR